MRFKSTSILFISTLCLLISHVVHAQSFEYDLQYTNVNVDCTDSNNPTICTDVQMKATNAGESYLIGSYTIFGNFNKDALNFLSYTPTAFFNNGIDSTVCQPTPDFSYSPYRETNSDASELDANGKWNVTSILSNYLGNGDQNGQGCDQITEAWTTMGNLCFTIDDPTATAALTFVIGSGATEVNQGNPDVFGHTAVNTPSINPSLACPACVVTVVDAVASTCDPSTSTYSVAVGVTYSAAPAGDITINGQTFTPNGSGSETFTLTGLTADGTTDIDVTATFVGDNTCTNTLTAAYNAPADCTPAVCSITVVDAVASTCDPSTNTYSVVVGVMYENQPTGDLTINGQTFTPTGVSPESFTLTGLTADGATNVGVTATFVDEPTCTNTLAGAYNAPANCTPAVCSVTVVDAVASTCDPSTNTYTTTVNVMYANQPTGNIDINGQIFTPTGTSPESFTLTGLTADGAMGVDVTAFFVNENTCANTLIDAYNAPANCTPAVCSVTVVDAVASTCDPSTNTYTVAVSVMYENQPTGDITINGQTFTPTGVSPETFILTGLTADGATNVGVTAFFVNDPTCTATLAAAYNAPVNCTPICPTFSLSSALLTGNICADSMLTTSIDTTGGDASFTIQWQVNGVDIAGEIATTLNYTVSNTSDCATETQSFQAIITCNGNVDTIQAGALTVYPALQQPSISTDPATCLSTITPACPTLETVNPSSYQANVGDPDTNLDVTVSSIDGVCADATFTVLVPTCEAAPTCPTFSLVGDTLTGDACHGDLINASVSAVDGSLPYTIQWQVNETDIIGETALNLTHSLVTTVGCDPVMQSFRAIIICDGQTTTIDAGTLMVYPALQAPFPSTDEVTCITQFVPSCIGDQILSGNYQAEDGDPATTTNVTVVSAAGGCTQVFEVDIPACNMGDCPTVTLATPPVSGNLCTGSDIQLGLSFTDGEFPVDIQWQINGANLTGETNATLDFTVISGLACETETVSFSANVVCKGITTTIDAGTVTIYPMPTMPTSSYDENTCTTTIIPNCPNIETATPPMYVANSGDGDTTINVSISNGVCPNFSTIVLIPACNQEIICPTFTLANDLLAGNICEGTTINTGITATGGNTPFTVQWQLNGVDIAGEMGNSFSTTVDNINQCDPITQNYTALITCNGNTETIDAGTVTVYPTVEQPTMSLDNSSGTTCVVTFAPICPNDVLDVTEYTAQFGDDETIVTVTASNSVCADLVTDFTVPACGEDLPQCPTANLVSEPLSGDFCENATVTATIEVIEETNGLDFSIQWQVNDLNIANQNEPTLNFPALNANDCDAVTQNFKAVVTCVDGTSIVVDAGTIMVYPKLEAPIATTDDETCITTFTPVCPTDILDVTSYTANIGDPETTINVTVSAPNDACPSIIEEFTIPACQVLVDDCPVATLASDTLTGDFCEGETTTIMLNLTEATLPATIQWQVNGVDIEGAVNQILNVTFNNDDPCTAQDFAYQAIVTCGDGTITTIEAGSVTVYPTLNPPTSSYNAETCETTFIPTCPTDILNPTSYTANIGDAATTVLVEVSASIGVCPDISVNLPINACEEVVNNCPIVTLDSTPLSGNVCTGETVTATVSATSGDLGFTIQWYANGVMIDGATEESVTYTVTTNETCSAIPVAITAIIQCDDLLIAPDTIDAGSVMVYPMPQAPTIMLTNTGQNGCNYAFIPACEDDVLTPATYTAAVDDPETMVTVSVSNAGCPAASFDVLIPACEILCLNPPNANTNPAFAPVCFEDGPTTLDLMTLVVGDMTGTWSGMGVTNNTFDASNLSAGLYLVTYTVTSTDPLCEDDASSEVIQVIDCNLPPVANNDNVVLIPTVGEFSFNVLFNDMDAEGDELTLVAVDTPPVAFGTLTFDENGLIVFTPNPNFTEGSITLSYTISDGVNTVDALVVITVDNCAADAGNLVASKLFYCNESDVVVTGLGFSTFDNYVQTYLLTTNTPPYNVVATSTTGTFSAVTSGEYNVYAVNHDSTTSFVLSDNIEAIQAQDNGTDDPCFAISEDVLDIVVFKPVTITGVDYCVPGQAGYCVDIRITGGSPEYFNNGQYEINLPPGLVAWDKDEQAAVFTRCDIPCIATFNMDVDNDGTLCTSEQFLLQGACDCPDACTPTPGIMPDSAFVCAGESSAIQSMGLAITSNNEVVTYVLYNADSSIVVTNNETGTFSLSDDPALTTNTVYNVTALIGIDGDMDGIPDVADTCTAIAQGVTALVFLDPINVELLEQDGTCLPDSTLTLTFNITGGYPAFAGGGNYIVNGVAVDGNMSTTTIVVTPDVIIGFTAMDEKGCVGFLGSDCEPLGVDLLTFTGEVLSTGNLLKWSTASEINSQYFTLHRSTDGVNFTAITELPTQEYSAIVTNYSFLDKEAPNGLAYYKLTETDVAGKVTEHNTITLTRGELALELIQVVPIPANEFIEVSFTNTTVKEVTLTVYDLTGRILTTQVVESNLGVTKVNVDINKLASGVYFIGLNNGNEVVNTKFVKQ